MEIRQVETLSWLNVERRQARYQPGVLGDGVVPEGVDGHALDQGAAVELGEDLCQ